MMYIHPTHCHEIYKARQKEREAEVRIHRIKQLVRGESMGHKLFVVLGSFSTSVQVAITQAISDQLRLVDTKDTR